MEILKLKITVTKIKISVDGLNSIIEGTKERINDLGDGTKKLHILNNKRK